MFDLAAYLKVTLSGDDQIKEVYCSAGNSEMSELLSDVRSVKFPCILVDIGSDGELNFSTSTVDRSIQSFYILLRHDVKNLDQRNENLRKAKFMGVEIVKRMRRDAYEFDNLCYGVDFSSIRYYKVSLGLDSYGYCFVISCTEE